MSRSSHEVNMDELVKDPSPSPELSVHEQNEQNEQPTRQEPKKKSDKLVETYEKFKENYPQWDLYMIFELFVFMLSFFFWVGESKDKDVRGADSFYLYNINAILLIDFLFRMLSTTIESIKREYWNHVLHCIVPLIMWLMAAFYKFDKVFGSDPIKVLNALLFTMLNLFILVVIMLKFVSIDKIKSLMTKNKENGESNSESNKDENNIV